MAEKAENKNILKLSKTYEFDGKNISELNLDLNNVSVEDMEQAERMLASAGKINPANVLSEFTMPYLMQLASIATRIPVEFYDRLSIKDAIAIKMRIITFFGASE